jgi:hypothetical protein
MKRINTFGTVRTEGGLLPVDLLVRVSAADTNLASLTPAGYHLAEGERLNEAINRSWNRLVGAWAGFRDAMTRVPADDRTATNVTRGRWSLVLFQELGYGQLQTAKSPEIDGKTYPISHAWGQVPVHLVGAKVDLDRRTEGIPGAATMSPHGLVQEYLNRSDDHLWGFVTNGLRLRLLRDNVTLTRQAFVEFDVETMMDGQEYADFAVLWLLCHQSRLEGDVPADCVLEKWSADAAKQGTRALDQLRGGVETAIAALGTGFLQHPANSQLRENLRSGELDRQDYYRQLLRLVYRLLFLFVAEDRNLLLHPDAPLAARDRYTRFYSLARIRELASRRRGTPHGDLWAQLQVVFTALGRAEGAPALGLSGLGSFLWSDSAIAHLDEAQLPNRHLLEAVLSLTSVSDGKVRRSVDYRNLGSEELGSVYESLLELHPDLSVEARRFSLSTAAGNERKTTGSYYTPTSLITELLDSALDPVLAEAAAKSNAEEAILDLKVIDPACGSGHFLIAAAHRIAKRLASVRTGDDEPSPDAIRHALRNVVGRCLHGIDMNPMAVELCKVSLWMEAMEPGKPLSFLDHRIVRGNALIGATPDLLDAGVPDDAFKPLTGDDKTEVTSLKKRNKRAREGQASLFGGGTGAVVSALAAKAGDVDEIDDYSVPAVRAKAARWSELVSSPEYQAAVHAADTWCAAFVAPKTQSDPAVTHDEFEVARVHPDRVDASVRAIVDTAAAQYGFLHWHLAFLDVYGSKRGFDVVLGNPPWEKVELNEKEYFSSRLPELARLSGAKRKSAISALRKDEPAIWSEYQLALRMSEGESHFLRSSGRYPLCGQGRVNTYAVFAEAMRAAKSEFGSCGFIVPSGIATDDSTKRFFDVCVQSQELVHVYDFENNGFFLGIAQGLLTRFALVVLRKSSAGEEREARFLFFGSKIGDIRDDRRCFVLSARDIGLINPNTKTSPVFQTATDASLAKTIYQRVPVLMDEMSTSNSWEVSFQQGMFNMTSDSGMFHEFAELASAGCTLEGNRFRGSDMSFYPLYEGKMIQQFDHRFGTYDGVDVHAGREIRSINSANVDQYRDPTFSARPRYWVSSRDAALGMGDIDVGWFIGFRDVTNATTNNRTVIGAAIPNGPFGHVLPRIRVSPARGLVLLAVMNSFVLDYCARQKTTGNHLTFYTIKQLPIPTAETFDLPPVWSSQILGDWIGLRVRELSFTSWHFRDMSGVTVAPYYWIEERRAIIRSELDAAMFHLYGLAQAESAYVLDTFASLCKRELATYGEFRTKRLILERYDAIADCVANGTEYNTALDPPPAHPSMAHPESTRPSWAT